MIKTLTLNGLTSVTIKQSAYDMARFCWIYNHSESDIFASCTDALCTGNADNVLRVPAGEPRMLDTESYETLYLNGSGTVELVTSAYAVCPFKRAAKGGDVKSISGASPYTLTDAVDYPVLGLNLYGKSVQDGTPTPDTPVDIVSVGDSGSVEVQTCGKNLFPWNDYTKAPIGDWGLSSGCTYKVTFSEIQMEVAPNTAGTGGGVFIWQDNCKDLISPYYGNTFTISYELRADSEITVRHGFEIEGINVDSVVGTEWKRFSCSTTIKKPCNICWKTINQPETILYIRKIQIELGSAATEYEPYTGNAAAITSALPLCGIPVDSGGNYTDKNGQQWVCDELIYNADGTGKIVKHTEKITYDDSYKIVSFSILGNCARFYIYNKNKPYTTGKSTKSMCDFMPCMSSYNNDVPHHYMQDYAIWIFVPVSELSTQDITGVTEWLSEKQPTFVYQLAEPQEIPLTTAEMAALRQLMTYSGTTNISNSDNAEMDVKYCINQVMADYYPIFVGQGADVQPLVLFQGTDEGHSLADGFTGFSAYYTDTPAGADIAITQGIDASTESRYGYRIAKAYGISDSGANYTDSAVISSNEEIDLTPYNMLLVDFYGYCDNSQISSVTSANKMAAYFRVDRPDKLPQSNTAYDWTDWDNMGMSYHKNSKYYFDVSQLTGKHYLCFGIYHGDYAIGYTNGIKIYKMTLI